MRAATAAEAGTRSELFLCLARAFLAPATPTHAEAMRCALADDLEELAAQLRLPVSGPLARLRAEAERLAGPDGWLPVYSALFLVPPVAARINAGWYLDGALDGGSVRDMEAAYLHCGLERDAGFRDLSDHVATQLEFVAWLYAGEAAALAAAAAAPPVSPGMFLHAYPRRWAAPLRADLAHAAGDCELPANPYLPLAEVLECAVLHCAEAPPVDAAAERRRHAIEGARAKRALRGITEEDLAGMRRKLAARGLDTGHLPRTVEAVREQLQAVSHHA
ncbi:MAG TPA: molecular chaperone TorD family protein [Ramlibacter sp.]